MLQLGANIHTVVQLLHGDLVALQCVLNDLGRLTLPLGQLVQNLGVLLLLVQHLLIHAVGLLGLLHELLDHPAPLMETITS